MAKLIGDSTYKFGFGTTSVSGISQLTDGSAERTYAVQQEILNGSGNITAILIGSEEGKASATGYVSGTSTPTLGNSQSILGISGNITKTLLASSNEDLTKVTVEIYGLTPPSTGGGGGGGAA